MGLVKKSSQLGLHVLLCAISLLCFVLKVQCEYGSDGEALIEFSKAPNEFSHRSSGLFVFRAFDRSGNFTACSSCNFTCRLDDGIVSNCEDGKYFYSNLKDGKHKFEVCKYGLQGLACANYNWTIDTVPPTAHITAPNSFTNALNFSVNISFSEPCIGFSCLSSNSCNVSRWSNRTENFRFLLNVYGEGQVIPASLNILQKNLKYSLAVSLSSRVRFGRVILVMDKNFCTDIAGNRFTRTANSSFYVHYDRRDVFVNLRLHIPERLLELNGQTRTILATNNFSHLKAYLYFSQPVLNSSSEILSCLNISQGSLVPINGESIGNRRFGFLIENVYSVSIVTLSLDAKLIISRHGTPVSPISPTTFLYDSKRPSVKLSTTSSTRTREHNIPILISFVKPVFGFNSSYVSVSGGSVQSFQSISKSTYIIGIKASTDMISVHVPENVTGDVSGNQNLASNVLQVRHYSVPLLSCIVSSVVTASFLATCLVAGILTFSTSSLQTVWTFKGPASLRTDPTRNLFRIACHIQVFAFSKWLAVMLPVEYYELVSGLQWAIPYFHLPWEVGHSSNVMVGSSPYAATSSTFQLIRGLNSSANAQVFGLPLEPIEYRFYFENPNTKPEAEVIWDTQNTNGWTNFDRSMFWLALIVGSLVLLHVILLFFLRLRKKSSENSKGFGALTFPRFEIFLIILALPCVSEVSAALVQGKDTSGLFVGVLLLSLVALALLALFFFLSYGITCANLLQYKEVHREGSTSRWYRELVRVTLGPGKRGQWTWKTRSNTTSSSSTSASSRYLITLGPLFEDLRGPPKYMLSQITEEGRAPRGKGGGGGGGDRIIASDDETEDAEAPIIQKLFGIMRIYYTLLECGKRVCLGAMAGLYMESWSSRTPSLTLLVLTSFQLFFLVLKKPFIKKKVQLVEIVSVSAELGLFTTCLVLSRGESRVGAFMVTLFLIGYVPQIANEWYSLYRQTMRLDPEEGSVLRGLKIALIGCTLVFMPRKLAKKLEEKYSRPSQGQSLSQSQSRSSANHSSEGYKSSSQSSGSTEKPWLRQLRELAKASFSREGTSNDPSSSQSVWSGIWGGSGKKSESQGLTSTDSKAKPKGLHKDLEDIFASK